MNPDDHWNSVYASKRANEVSWFQPHPEPSFSLIKDAVPDRDAPILDAGGGASTLVDELLGAGFRNLTIVDISAAALDQSRERLGAAADQVTWLVADLLTASIPERQVALWHDRAVFHFLIDPADQTRYIEQVSSSLLPDGLLLLGTFSADGPLRCSSLPVARYSIERMDERLGASFQRIRTVQDNHRTPGGSIQPFTYGLYRFVPRP